MTHLCHGAVGLVLCGAVVDFLPMEAAAYELMRLCGLGTGIKRLFRLVWTPYVAAGPFVCCSAALESMEPGAAL